ncbi:MAG: FAD-dependent oxidoreductase [Bacteroidetes bacterium]|jgi:sulfide:quinone oxidoreductase|nr:FAD-dependent oxidoreductase [Bacteroidota bacterium]
MKPTILVLGGGIGGVTVAKQLRNEMGNEDGINLARILVFEKEKSTLFAPSLTWMMVGKRKEEQIRHPMDGIEFGGVEIVYGEIESVDPDTHTVISGGNEYRGDYIVISLGAEKRDKYDLNRFGHNFYTSEGASDFYKELSQFKSGNIAVTVSSLPHTSPVAPYEAALLIEDTIREKGCRDAAEITLYTPENRPMPFANEKISAAVRRLMEEKGIQYRPKHQLKGADENSLSFSDPTKGSAEEAYDLLAYTPKHTCPALLEEAGLTGESGWVEVDSKTLQTPFDKVYAIGDIASLQGHGKPAIPMAGFFAEVQARVVAHNIARRQAGKSPDQTFEASGSYILDQGTTARKVDGRFDSDDLSLSNNSLFRHWEKVLAEKAWFLKHFQS